MSIDYKYNNWVPICGSPKQNRALQQPLAPMAVKILLCRVSAQKIASPVRLRSGAAYSGKKLLKNINPKK